jgi:hypothetical protein
MAKTVISFSELLAAPRRFWGRGGLRRLLSSPLLIFTLWALYLSFPYWGLGGASYVRIHDVGDSHIPARLALVSQQWGWWNPLALCGVDGGTSKPLGPESLLYFVMPGWLAYGLFMALQRFVAGYGTYLLLRRMVKLDQGPCMAAGLFYALFPQETNNVAWAGFTIYDGLGVPGLPLFLLGLHALSSTRPVMCCLGAAALGGFLAATAGYVFAPFIFAMIGFWFVFIQPQTSLRFWSIMPVMALGWLIVSLPFVWVGLLHAPWSHRALWGMDSPLSDPGRQINMVEGLLRDNALPLILGGLGFAFSRGRSGKLWAISVPLMICLTVVACYVPLRNHIILPYLGFLAGFQFDRFYLILPFLAVVWGATGLQAIREDAPWAPRSPRGARWVAGARTGLVALAILATFWSSVQVYGRIRDQWIGGAKYATLYEHPDLKRLAATRSAQEPFRVATVAEGAGLMHPGYAWAYGLESADGYVAMYPARYHAFWGRVIQPLTRQSPTCYNYFQCWGSRAYLFSPFPYVPHLSKTEGERCANYYNLDLLSLANVRYLISREPLQGAGLRLVPSPGEAEREAFARLSALSKVVAFVRGDYPGMRLHIYENMRVLPRFFLAARHKTFPKADDLVNALSAMGTADLRAVALLASDDWPALPDDTEQRGESEVRVERYQPDLIELQVQSGAAAILVIGNSYSPHWRAWIDGSPEAVRPVDCAFQGLPIAAGKHTVRLAYRPPYRPGGGR